MLWRKETSPTATELRLDHKLSKEEINALPVDTYRGPLELVRSHEKMLDAVKELRKERLLGFDTETRPAFEKGVSYPVSILQLATSDCVYVFQLEFLGDLKKLFTILSNKKIIKAGVATGDDIKALRELSEFIPAGVIDLATRTKQCGMQHHGLRGLTALLLDFRITKSRQKYNWATHRLNKSAIQYAATDAWVGRELYLSMKKLGLI
jgi:ribonuclease D